MLSRAQPLGIYENAGSARQWIKITGKAGSKLYISPLFIKMGWCTHVWCILFIEVLHIFPVAHTLENLYSPLFFLSITLYYQQSA